MSNTEKVADNPPATTHWDRPRVHQERGGEVRLIFEETAQGRSGFELPDDVDHEIRAREALGEEHCRADIEDFPEMSEPQVVRHFLRLSQLNFGQALQFYPLG